MTKHCINKRYVLVALLCLWLPVQALAGALAHCEQIAQSGTVAAQLADAADNDCHGQTAERSNDRNDSGDGHHCIHCSGTCHSMQSLMSPADRLLSSLAWPDQVASSTVNISNGYFNTPQRPPRQSS